MRPALSTVCSLHAPLEAILADYAAGHCDAVELWLGQAEAFLEKKSPDELKDCFAMHAVVPVVASFQGGLLVSQGAARREHWQHFDAPFWYFHQQPFRFCSADEHLEQRDQRLCLDHGSW